MIPAKTAAAIETVFGVASGLGPKNEVLHGVEIPPPLREEPIAK